MSRQTHESLVLRRVISEMPSPAGSYFWPGHTTGYIPDRVPQITQPRKERKLKEHNTSMTETRAARVEQNTRHKAEPSTLYQIYIDALIK